MQKLPRRKFLTGVGQAAVAVGIGCLAPTAPAGANGSNLPVLEPQTGSAGPAVHFDFPALEVGVAQYPQGPTGCTVLHFPGGATAAVDVRGGAPGTINTDQLQSGDGFVHALVFAGGSLYGLEAAAGVSAELLARRHFSTQWNELAVVSGAILFDFTGRTNAIYPDKALGAAALKSAVTGAVPVGRCGAGSGALVGKWLTQPYVSEPGGQGAAFKKFGGTRILVVTVVNSLGAIVDRQGQVVRGHLNSNTGRRHHITDLPSLKNAGSPGNTCLTTVVTNRKLSPRGLRQLARQVHDSMSRAIEPFHTALDGDVLFALTTNEVAGPEDFNDLVLATAASELAWDAVLSSFAAP